MRATSPLSTFHSDGHSVVYQHIGPDGLSAIWRIGLDGGPPVRLDDCPIILCRRGAGWTPRGVWVCADLSDPKWEIAIYNSGATEPLRRFSFPNNRMPEPPLHWMPKEDAIGYTETAVSNIWAQPVNGGPPRQLTSFPSAASIRSIGRATVNFSTLADGVTTSDVVLMRDHSK